VGGVLSDWSGGGADDRRNLLTIVTIEAILALILVVGVWMMRHAPPDDVDEQQDH
jgi:hypothetical protein